MVRSDKELDDAIDEHMNAIADATIGIVKLVVEQVIPEFMDWFLRVGGSFTLPKGKTIGDLTDQYIKEELDDE